LRTRYGRCGHNQKEYEQNRTPTKKNMNKGRYPKDYRKDLYQYSSKLVLGLVLVFAVVALLHWLGVLLFGFGFLPV